MGYLSKVLQSEENCGLTFWCPGCNTTHTINYGDGSGPRWSWNGNIDKPTFSPSILVRVGHYAPDRGSKECWCTYNEKHPEEVDPFICVLCHSYINDGKIQFLNDCSHSLAGSTVDMIEKF